MGLITEADVGYNGITEDDVGKYWVICPRSYVIYIRETRDEAEDLYETLITKNNYHQRQRQLARKR